MWYTKHLIFFPYSYFGLIEMLDSSGPPSSPLLLDISSGIGSLLVVRMHVKPLPEFETSTVSKGILSLVVGNSQIGVYVAYLS
jgi:hypothetical protein